MLRSLKRAGFALLLLALAVGASAQVPVKQSSTSRKLVFLMVDSTDHVTGKTGLTVTVTLSKNGAAFAAPAGTVTELANGYYVLTPTSADTGTVGTLILHATATGADPSDREYNVVAYDPDDAAALGLSRIDAAISSRSTYAGVDTTGVTTLLTRIPGVVQPQTGDSYARLGAPVGASISADIAGGAAAVWAAATRTLTGNVIIGGYASGQDPATLLNAVTVDGTLTWKQVQTLQASLALDGDRTWTAATHTAVLTYYRRLSGSTLPDRTRPILTKTTVYDSTNAQVISQTVTLSNLP